MTLTSAEARKRWGEVLDAANRGEATVITRRGKPLAVVLGWPEPSRTAPLPLLAPLLALMPSGWRVFAEPERGLTVFLHPTGLWFEVDQAAVVEMGQKDASAVAAAATRAVGDGLVGRASAEVSKVGGVISARMVPLAYPREVWRGTYAEHRERLRARGLDLVYVGTPPIIPDGALVVATIQCDGGPEHYTVVAPTTVCANPTGYTTVRVSGG